VITLVEILQDQDAEDCKGFREYTDYLVTAPQTLVTEV
jgi:hypothetical protein